MRVLRETLYKLSVVSGLRGLLMSLPVRATVTAKVGAVTPKGDEGVLVEFLRTYRDSVQLVIDEIWV